MLVMKYTDYLYFLETGFTHTSIILFTGLSQTLTQRHMEVK
jgi:hypothetical protein